MHIAQSCYEQELLLLVWGWVASDLHTNVLLVLAGSCVSWVTVKVWISLLVLFAAFWRIAMQWSSRPFLFPLHKCQRTDLGPGCQLHLLTGLPHVCQTVADQNHGKFFKVKITDDTSKRHRSLHLHNLKRVNFVWLKKNPNLFFFFLALFLAIHRRNYAKYQDEFVCAPFKKKISIQKFVCLGRLN